MLQSRRALNAQAMAQAMAARGNRGGMNTAIKKPRAPTARGLTTPFREVKAGSCKAGAESRRPVSQGESRRLELREMSCATAL